LKGSISKQCRDRQEAVVEGFIPDTEQIAHSGGRKMRPFAV
jgi:hypothetical protein